MSKMESVEWWEKLVSVMESKEWWEEMVSMPVYNNYCIMASTHIVTTVGRPISWSS